MHNQDTTKDDLLETFLELAKDFQKYLMQQFKELMKQRELQKKAEALEKQLSDSLNNNDTGEYKDFKDAMKYISENSTNPKVKEMAKLFHDNPKDGLALLQDANKQQGIEASKRIDQTSPVIISTLKKVQLINNNRDVPDQQVANTIKQLIDNEEKNMEVAATASSKIEQSFEIKGHKIKNEELAEIARLFKGSMQQRNNNVQKETNEEQLNNTHETLSSSSSFTQTIDDTEQLEWTERWGKRTITDELKNVKNQKIESYLKNNGLQKVSWIDEEVNHVDEIEPSLLKEKDSYLERFSGLSENERNLQEQWNIKKKTQIAVYLKLDDPDYEINKDGIEQISERKFLVKQEYDYNTSHKKLHIIEFPETEEEVFKVTYSQSTDLEGSRVRRENKHEFLSDIDKYTSKVFANQFERNLKVNSLDNKQKNLQNDKQSEVKELKKSKHNDIEMER